MVDCVDLHLAPGEHVALIGSNGSGKSTLLRAIWGLHPLASGRIVCDEREATTPTAWYIRCKRIAWMPQRQATGQFLLLVRELLANSGHQEMAYAALPQAMSTERPTRHSHQNTSNHPNLV